MARYNQLLHEIGRIDTCATIVEIGTWNGVRACELASAALKRNHSVTYYGFDLFELLDEKLLERELSKRPPAKAEVEERLGDFRRRVERRSFFRSARTFTYELIQGFTTETLPDFSRRDIDVVFIDGGHSIETIANDWRWCSKLVRVGGIVLLDDYYVNSPFTDRFGCNQLIESIQHEPGWAVSVLPKTDLVPGIGGIKIARAVRVAT